MPESQSKHITMTSHDEALAKLKQDMRITNGASIPAMTAKPQSSTKKQAAKATSNETTTALHHVEYPSRALYLINAWRMHGHL